MKRYFLLFLVLLMPVCLAPEIASAITIIDTASGDIAPQVLPPGNDVVNGDFLIHNNPTNCCTTGDGSDELTTWTFDFTGDPDYMSFTASGSLTSALLTLEITPKSGDVYTDYVTIVSLPGANTPVIQDLPVGPTATIQLELLDFYSSTDILGVFNANSGQLPMLYSDDAIISFAQLNLTAVPEPSTLSLIGFGLVGISLLGKRKFKKN